MARRHKQPKRGDDKHLKRPGRQGGSKHPKGHLGAGMKMRGVKTGKKKGHGGGKSVATPGGKHGGGVKASHGPTFGRVAPPMGRTQGSPKTAGTDLGGNRAKARERRLQDAQL